MLEINNSSYKYKTVDAIDIVMLTYFLIKFSDFPLFLCGCKHTNIYKPYRSSRNKRSNLKFRSHKITLKSHVDI
jgi:hypothetical protein